MSFRDLAYAVRTLRKSPVFAITAIVTIALGIAASTAIFSVTDAVLLRPLPYRDPDRLVFAISDMSKRAVKDFPFSNEDFLDVREGTASAFEEMGAVFTGRFVAPREDGTPEQIRFGECDDQLLPHDGRPGDPRTRFPGERRAASGGAGPGRGGGCARAAEASGDGDSQL